MKPAKAYEKIDEKLKTIRVRLNMSQAEFGERLGLTKASISTYERGIRTPSWPVLCLMADEYRVNMAYLETGIEPIFVGQEGDKRESILPSQQDADRATADVIAAFLALPAAVRLDIAGFLCKCFAYISAQFEK